MTVMQERSLEVPTFDRAAPGAILQSTGEILYQRSEPQLHVRVTFDSPLELTKNSVKGIKNAIFNFKDNITKKFSRHGHSEDQEELMETLLKLPSPRRVSMKSSLKQSSRMTANCCSRPLGVSTSLWGH